MQQDSARSLWTAMESEHTPYAVRAREASALTLPYLIPPQGSNGSTHLPTPHQSVGARGVNNVASKLLLTLFPPSAPFFTLQVDEGLLELAIEASMPPELPEKSQRAEQLAIQYRTQVMQTALASEKRIAMEFESKALRSPLFIVLQHLVVGGTVGTLERKDGTLRPFSIEDLRCSRRPDGRIDLGMFCEEMQPHALPDEWKHLAEVRNINTMTSGTKPVKLYTVAKYVSGKGMYEMYQEIEPAADNVPPARIHPWGKDLIEPDLLPMEILALHTEDDCQPYGRGLVEQYIGDLLSFDGLMQNIVEGSANASRLLWLVNPNSQYRTRVSDLATAPNGAFRVGHADDITALSMEKYADFQTAWATAQDIKIRLEQAFLLNHPRQSERTTAEEVRIMAQELEDTLGGTYSNLAVKLQAPIVRRIMARLNKERRLPEMPDGIVQPKVIAGLEALGRGHEYTRMMAFTQAATQALGPQVLEHMEVSEFLLRLATASGLDAAGLIKSAEKVAQERQAQQQQALMEKAAAPATAAVGNIVQDQVQQGGSE